MSASADAVPSPQGGNAVGDLAELVKVVMRSHEEQMRTHERILQRDLRWRLWRTALWALTLVGGSLLYALGVQRLLAPTPLAGPYAALVRIEGLIDSDARSNAHKVNEALRAAFDDPQAKGVVVLVNSPGGSAVQSALIHDRLLSLREQHPEKGLWVVGEDMLTSGAYYIAVAADHICVNRGTMAGSIGVVMSGWGLDHAIERFRIERRLFTAGENKARLDAFRPLTPQDRTKAATLLEGIHRQFIAAVTAGRGSRLKGATGQLWSGDYWLGEEAVALGLVDGLCDLESVLDQQFGVRAVRDYTVAPNLWAKLANSFGVAAEQWVLGSAGGLPQVRLTP
jgi:protease-4